MAARLVQLGPQQEAEALRFCARHPEGSTFIAGWLSDGGLRRTPQSHRAWLFADLDDEGRAHGLVYISETGIVVPILSRDEGLEGLTELGRRNTQAIRVIVGERACVNALMGVWNFPVRLERDQLAYCLEHRDGLNGVSHLPLQVADLEHLDPLMHASAEMAKEEAGDDPYGRNPKLFRARIRERIHRGRDFVHVDAGELRFKCNVSALSELGGQIEGIYTIPSQRGQGLGRRGTAAITAWVLERARRATLLVNEDNRVAKKLYLDLGYREVYESRTVFFV